jgi:HEAT repeat protein
MTLRPSCRLGAIALLVVSLLPPHRAAEPGQYPDRVIRDALFGKTTIHAQEEELIQLAWLREEVPSEVAERARVELERFGARSIPALRRALSRVPSDRTESVLQTILVARQSQAAGIPLDFVPALVDALWIGSREAKRLAVPALAMPGEKTAILPMIDSALQDPSLTPDVVRALGVIGDDRARFFLEQVLRSGGPGDRESAAISLARIGGRALTPLRDALRAGEKDVRLAAARALLPIASPDDLTAFYTYLANHEDDDPGTAQAIRAAAAVIEEKQAAQQAADAASAPKDF